MSKSTNSTESPQAANNNTNKKNPRDKRSHREIVEANLRALKHTRLAFQR